MDSKFTKYKVIKFPVLFVRSLAKDFEEKNLKWVELYSLLFEKGTDIYREMRVTLASFGISMQDNVSYDKTFDETLKEEVVFELEEKIDGRRILTNLGTKEEIIVPKKASVNVTFGKMGYTQKVNKIK